MRRRPLILFLALLSVFLWGLPSARAASRWAPSSEKDARQKALDLFCECAFHAEYLPYTLPQYLNRWEQEITIWMGGNPTKKDREALDAFLRELQENVPGLPALRRVREDYKAKIRIWYVPEYSMFWYIPGYVTGNYGFFSYETDASCRIVSARIGLATDAADQKERIHLMKEELVGALGLPGDHETYRDSILYDPWTEVQTLSDVDWRMLRYLYSSWVSPGMSEKEARTAILAHLDPLPSNSK